MSSDRASRTGTDGRGPDETGADEPRTGPADVEPDLSWVWRLWAVVAVFFVITLVRSWQVDIPLRDVHGSILRSRVAISFAVFVGAVLVDVAWRTPRPGWSLPAAWAVLRARWTPRRVALLWSGLLAYHLVYFSYHNLKSWDVFNSPRDDLLTRMDRWLFLGHSPAVLLHDLLGQDVATWVLMVWYESFPTIVTISFVAIPVLATRMRQGYVFLASMIWVWILGVACYYAIPSLGPFDDEPQIFAGLPETIVSRTQVLYMAQRAHLLADPAAPDAFAQVSAFASLHVGVTAVITGMLLYYGFRRLFAVMMVYLAGTIVATVHLGWHFFVDDIAGLLIAGLAIALGHYTIHPRGPWPRRRQQRRQQRRQRGPVTTVG